eukprot:5858942-Pleurochrysis_carterae.AAC.1
MVLTLFLALAYGYLALGARALKLSHRGASPSLPTRVTLDVDWWNCSRYIGATLSFALRGFLTAGATAWSLDLLIHDI